MASAKRIIIGDSSTSEDWIPCIGETEYYAYIGGEKIPHWTTADTQPVSALTSNTKPSPYAVYSSSYYSDDYSPWRAFQNKNPGAYGWASSPYNLNFPAWICLDLGESNALKNIKVTLWNRQRSSYVNGPKAITIYGGDIAPTSGGSGNGTVKDLPNGLTNLGSFSGLSGSTSLAEAVLDTIGNDTSGAIRSLSELYNSANNYFRYIYVACTEWEYSTDAKYCAIGQIRIDGKKMT